MKFGTLIEQKMLCQMIPRPPISNVDIKVKFKIKLWSINDFGVDFERNVGLQRSLCHLIEHLLFYKCAKFHSIP